MIIYKATNLINRKIYIGQTIERLCKRRGDHNSDSLNFRRNNYFNKAIRKYGVKNFEWEEIDMAESFEELDYLEAYWIKWYHSNDRRYGYNLAIGGRVNRGFKKTKEQREECSKRMKELCRAGKVKSYFRGKFGKEHPSFGKPRTEEVRKKISMSNKGKIRSEKICKKVRCIETGVIYRSISDAAKLNNFHINNLRPLLHGRGKTCRGFHWEFVNPKNRDNSLKIKRKYTKMVRCMETQIVYKSAKDAANSLNIGYGHICCACKGRRKTVGGFHWEYVKNNDNL